MSRHFLVSLTLLSPLIGFIISFALRKYRIFVKYFACFSVFCSLVAYLIFLYRTPFGHIFLLDLLVWIKLDTIKIYWGAYVDSLSTLMMGLVLVISCLVHIYSLGYMAYDKNFSKFMSYLNLFTFTMLLLILSPNLLQLFAGLEGVGLSSYLLIGFWHKKKQARISAFKAFIMNRAADIALIIAILSIYFAFESFEFFFIEPSIPSYSDVFVYCLGYKIHVLTFIACMLMIGAMAKSAQFGLHSWLPDAMTGPTPASALIHAATMVTAGIFLIVRFSTLFQYKPLIRYSMIVIGSLTAFFGASVAITQKDIKRVVAYSTCSQLGYMFMACGCGAYTIAIFHLITHAFFKALLFLGVGAITHSMSDEKNIFKMGGIYQFIPTTYLVMWVGALSLAGIPFFSGYYSKELILASLYSSNNMMIFIIALVVITLTALYIWRLIMIVFHGYAKADDQVMAHIHQVPLSMMIPLFILAFISVVSGWLGYNFLIEQKWGFVWGEYIQKVSLIPNHCIVPSWVSYISVLFSVSGVFVSIVFYKFFWGGKYKEVKKYIHKFLYKKWFIDELYHYVFVSPVLWFSRFLSKNIDDNLIDRYGPRGIISITFKVANIFRGLHSGYLYHYALIMIISITLAIAVYCFCFDLKIFKTLDEAEFLKHFFKSYC